MARATMSDLITKLRGKTNAGTADFTVAGETYFTDDQLQSVLDQHQMHSEFLNMTAVAATGESLAITYKRYETGLTDWENLPTIQDENGDTLGTATYSFDANTGVVTFEDDTEGLARYITGNVYNVDRAAAQVWRDKAAFVAAGFDFSTDNHSVKRSQVYNQYIASAQFYDNQAGPRQVSFYRSDLP